MNDLTAGTEHQERIISEYRIANPDWLYNYESALKILCDMQEDNTTSKGINYLYGSQWLLRPMRDSDVEEFNSIIERLNASE